MSGELEDLNREAWRTNRPFIATEYGTFRAISPEMFRQQRIVNEIQNAWMDVLKFNVPRSDEDEEISLCIGEMK